MQYTDVVDPVYGAMDASIIYCRVKFDVFDQYVPFAAATADTTEHGRKIYAALVAGEFGPVGPYVAASGDVLAAEIRTRRNRLLAQTDWTQLDDVPEVTRNRWQVYRQSLRDVTSQRTFPDSVEWPAEPAA